MASPQALRAVLGPLDESGTAQSWDAEIDDANAQPLIPDAVYVVRFLGWETIFMFRTSKILLRFEVAEGDHAGVRLIRAYRVQRLIGRPGKGGRFKLGRGSDLLRDVVRLIDLRVRPDRVSLAFLKGRLWQVKTRTVVTDYRQRPIPEALRYSIVDEIVCAETG